MLFLIFVFICEKNNCKTFVWMPGNKSKVDIEGLVFNIQHLGWRIPVI